MITTFTINVIILFIVALLLLLNLIYKNKKTFFNSHVYDNDNTTPLKNTTEPFINTSIYDVDTIKSTVDSIYNINMDNIRILSSNIDKLLNGNVPNNLTMIGNFNIIPTGYIMAYIGTSDIIQYTDFDNNSIVGWFICDGRAISQLIYNNLFSVIGKQFNNAETDNASFNLPDYRGAFLRGNGTSFNNSDNVSAPLNTSQFDSIKNHTHNIIETPHTHTMYTQYDKLDWVTYYAASAEDTPEKHEIMMGQNVGKSGKNIGRGPNKQIVDYKYPSNQIETYRTSNNKSNINLQGVMSYNGNTINVGLNETRPINYAVNWIIKT